MKPKYLLPAGLVVLQLTLLGFPPQRDSDARQALEVQLRSEYRWAQVDGRSGNVLAPGSVFVVLRDGISTNPVVAPLNAQNNYKDGQVKRSALNLFTQEQATAGRFVSGDRVFVTKTEVKDSAVVLSLVSVDPIGGMRTKASVAFQFAKGFWSKTDFNQVARVIDELLGVPQEAMRAAPPPPIQAASAPPPPSPTPAPTVELGATVEQVEVALGPPAIIAEVGRKQIYVYPDLKVTFLDGKVTDMK